MDTWLRHVVGWGGLLALALSTAWLFTNATALRDESTQTPRPYSLSRVQLAWWTQIILGAYVGVFAWKGEFWPLSSTCLALLGIGAGTGVAGRIVDTRQQENQQARHQDAAPSNGLFSDILSDENGISMHRFQTVAFNLVYGVAFLVETFQDGAASAFPTFDSTTLLVLGVSSGVYIAVKPNEAGPLPATLGQSSAGAGAASFPGFVPASAGTPAVAPAAPSAAFVATAMPGLAPAVPPAPVPAVAPASAPAAAESGTVAVRAS